MHDDRAVSAVDRVTLHDKVAFLRTPAAYTERPERIEAIETHMSWVFLTEQHAYKLKKPVRYDFLDFSTLALRRFDCDEEVRLNRRFAPEVYLGTVALALDAQGRLQLEGEGEVVEWLVKMRRLPASRMLNNMIRAGTAQEREIRELAGVLARCYRHCASVAIGPAEYRAHFLHDVALNRDELLTPVYAMSRQRIERLHAAQTNFLQREPDLLDARVAAGRILEGHGDLRPEHVCLQSPPVVIDCLEFNRRFRTIDPAEELAFLTMECEFLGAPWIGEVLLPEFEAVAGDTLPPRLINFYRLYRACLRARLSIAHIRELAEQDWLPWQRRADAYLDLADMYCKQLGG